MINPKELMLGNWIYWNESTKYPMQVVDISQDMIYLDFEGNEGDAFDGIPKEICPIPLTSDIFIKNGFEYSFECFCGLFYLDKYPSIEFYEDEDCRGKFYRSFNSGEYKLSDKPIKYVHQLQNILTIAGIEIDFKI